MDGERIEEGGARRPWLVGALVVLCAACGSGGTGRAPERFVVAPLVERYPSGEALYARNPWDLVAFDGRLFVGAGNSANWGPIPNAGPVPVVALDPSTGEATVEHTVADEQIDVFVPIGDALWIPGHDPTSGFAFGNLYRRGPAAADGWATLGTVPGAIHVYALIERDGALWAGLASVRNGVAARSLDGGETWTEHRAPGLRIHAFLEVEGEFYAAGAFSQGLRPLGYRAISRWVEREGAFVPAEHLTAEVVFPDTPGVAERLVRVVRPVRIGLASAYVGGLVHADHQYLPFGAYVARDLSAGGVDVRRLPLPTDEEVWDLAVEGERLYALTSREDGPGDWTLRIWEVGDPEGEPTVAEVARTQAETFGRSFARLGGRWYVGLGSEVADPRDFQLDELSSATGDILGL